MEDEHVHANNVHADPLLRRQATRRTVQEASCTCLAASRTLTVREILAVASPDWLQKDVLVQIACSPATPAATLVAVLRTLADRFPQSGSDILPLLEQTDQAKLDDACHVIADLAPTRIPFFTPCLHAMLVSSSPLAINTVVQLVNAHHDSKALADIVRLALPSLPLDSYASASRALTFARLCHPDQVPSLLVASLQAGVALWRPPFNTLNNDWLVAIAVLLIDGPTDLALDIVGCVNGALSNEATQPLNWNLMLFPLLSLVSSTSPSTLHTSATNALRLVETHIKSYPPHATPSQHLVLCSVVSLTASASTLVNDETIDLVPQAMHLLRAHPTLQLILACARQDLMLLRTVANAAPTRTPSLLAFFMHRLGTVPTAQDHLETLHALVDTSLHDRSLAPTLAFLSQLAQQPQTPELRATAIALIERLYLLHWRAWPRVVQLIVKTIVLPDCSPDERIALAHLLLAIARQSPGTRGLQVLPHIATLVRDTHPTVTAIALETLAVLATSEVIDPLVTFATLRTEMCRAAHTHSPTLFALCRFLAVLGRRCVTTSAQSTDAVDAASSADDERSAEHTRVLTLAASWLWTEAWTVSPESRHAILEALATFDVATILHPLLTPLHDSVRRLVSSADVRGSSCGAITLVRRLVTYEIESLPRRMLVTGEIPRSLITVPAADVPSSSLARANSRTGQVTLDTWINDTLAPIVTSGLPRLLLLPRLPPILNLTTAANLLGDLVEEVRLPVDGWLERSYLYDAWFQGVRHVYLSLTADLDVEEDSTDNLNTARHLQQSLLAVRITTPQQTANQLLARTALVSCVVTTSDQLSHFDVSLYDSLTAADLTSDARAAASASLACLLVRGIHPAPTLAHDLLLERMSHSSDPNDVAVAGAAAGLAAILKNTPADTHASAFLDAISLGIQHGHPACALAVLGPLARTHSRLTNQLRIAAASSDHAALTLCCSLATNPLPSTPLQDPIIAALCLGVSSGVSTEEQQQEGKAAVCALGGQLFHLVAAGASTIPDALARKLAHACRDARDASIRRLAQFLAVWATLAEPQNVIDTTASSPSPSNLLKWSLLPSSLLLHTLCEIIAKGPPDESDAALTALSAPVRLPPLDWPQLLRTRLASTVSPALVLFIAHVGNGAGGLSAPVACTMTRDVWHAISAESTDPTYRVALVTHRLPFLVDTCFNGDAALVATDLLRFHLVSCALDTLAHATPSPSLSALAAVLYSTPLSDAQLASFARSVPQLYTPDCTTPRAARVLAHAAASPHVSSDTARALSHTVRNYLLAAPHDNNDNDNNHIMPLVRQFASRLTPLDREHEIVDTLALAASATHAHVSVLALHIVRALLASDDVDAVSSINPRAAFAFLLHAHIATGSTDFVTKMIRRLVLLRACDGAPHEWASSALNCVRHLKIVQSVL